MSERRKAESGKREKERGESGRQAVGTNTHAAGAMSFIKERKLSTKLYARISVEMFRINSHPLPPPPSPPHHSLHRQPEAKHFVAINNATAVRRDDACQY